MDIDIQTKDRHFKYRTCAIILNDNKVLVVEMMHNGFYCLPGGHVHIGEDSGEALIREVKEEVECNVTIDKLVGIHENFFNRNNKAYHELGFYYLVKVSDHIKIDDYVRTENDCGQEKELNFKWINIDELNRYDIRPLFIKEKIINSDYNFVHLITKDI